MNDKYKHVCIHEMSHLVVFLYLGGSPDDIREMQVKPNNGYLIAFSHSIALNYFTHACLALAGAISDSLISGEIEYQGDIDEAKGRMRQGLIQRGVSQQDLERTFDFEYQIAWDFTRSILVEQTQTILQLAAEADGLVNTQKKISRTKIQKLSWNLLGVWRKKVVHYYPRSSDVSIDLLASFA